MGRIGTGELVLILGILVLLFGASKLPAIGRGLGEGIKNFKDAFREGSSSEEKREEKPDKKVH